MSTDVQRITDASADFHELWSCPIEIGIALYMLTIEIGLALLGPLIVIILAASANSVISSKIAIRQREWLAGIQTRVDVTAKVLQQMKVVKMLGLSLTLGDLIGRLRTNEIISSIKARRLTGYSMICSNSTGVFAPGSAFAAFVIIAIYNRQTLDVGRAYTTISLIQLLSDPISVMIFVVPQFMTAIGCFERVQKYLLSTSRQDHRLPIQTTEILRPPKAQNVTATTQHASLGESELDELSEVAVLNRRTDAYTPTIRAVNCTLAWNDGGRAVVNDLSFELCPGLTMLVGPVGSGKSSLLKGLLGELPSSKGYIYTSSTQAAFVDQVPWIRHGTLRENILGTSSFEHNFYFDVLYACALDQDIGNLPDGDSTSVGSAGIGLSGGQKLRVVRILFEFD